MAMVADFDVRDVQSQTRIDVLQQPVSLVLHGQIVSGALAIL